VWFIQISRTGKEATVIWNISTILLHEWGLHACHGKTRTKIYFGITYYNTNHVIYCICVVINETYLTAVHCVSADSWKIWFRNKYEYLAHKPAWSENIVSLALECSLFK
jgi:hypothetical protein